MRFLIIWLLLFHYVDASETLKIGSKRFTESYIIGEILKRVAIQTGEANVDYKAGLGNTGIIFAALEKGAIDVYPEYTGTIAQELLKIPLNQPLDMAKLNERLRPYGVAAAIPLGFNNSYALAMNEEQAKKLNIRRISDLKQYPQVKLGFSHEFLKRNDGWEALKNAYRLPHKHVIGIDHSLGYEALANHQIDVMDIYRTDPKAEAHHFRVLEDDISFFPVYDAIILYRLDVPTRFPKTWKAFEALQGSITNEEMLLMNSQAEIEGESFASIANWFAPSDDVDTESTKLSFLNYFFGEDFWLLAKQHLFLVFGSLAPAILVGVLLGILATYSFTGRHLILNVVGAIQTIPSLALLAFLIPLLQQIGTLPALLALFLYSLLPIVRNTYTGLSDIPAPLKESAIVLGLPLFSRLTKVEIPLAARSILGGIKTAAVLNVGMATIAALIGAGGFGERIITGLALNDYSILLSGAIPACLLAILVQLSFDLLDYWLIPKGLK